MITKFLRFQSIVKQVSMSFAMVLSLIAPSFAQALEIKSFGHSSFLIRGGKQLEKETTGYERTVVVEFPDFNIAKECYESNEYQKALSHVNKSANRTVAIVEGLT